MRISKVSTGDKLKDNHTFGDLQKGDSVYIIRAKQGKANIAEYSVTNLDELEDPTKQNRYTYTDFYGNKLTIKNRVYVKIKKSDINFANTDVCFVDNKVSLVSRQEYPVTYISDKTMICPYLRENNLTTDDIEYIF